MSEYVQSGPDARLEESPIILKLARLGRRRLWVIGTYALAVDIHGEDVKPQFGKHFCPLPLILTQPFPLMSHQYSWTPPFKPVVVNRQTFQDRVALFVLDGFLLDGSV